MVELQMAFIGDQDKNIPEEQTTTKFDREVDTTQKKDGRHFVESSSLWKFGTDPGYNHLTRMLVSCLEHGDLKINMI